MKSKEETIQEVKKDQKKGYKKVFIRRPPDEKNVKSKVVGVNGKMYTVPYDKEVEVPKCVALIIEESQKAQEKALELEEALLSGNN